MSTEKPRRQYNVVRLAPYEPDSETRPVGADHGGYGVLVEGYITGPFFWYVNAQTALSKFTCGRIVRWVDFVAESTKQKAFERRLAKATAPFTVKVLRYRELASVDEAPVTRQQFSTAIAGPH